MNQLAQKVTNPFLTPSLQSQSGESFLSKLLSTAVTLGLIIGSVAFFFMLILGGLQWITSAGDKATLESARGRISHALIGLLVLFCVFLVANLIQTIFSVNILKIDLGPLKIQ